MVGHTGVESAAIKAIETVDACVGRAVDAIKEVNGEMFICADHGNAEQLVDYETGEPWTAHTTNQVPFILVNADPSYKLREGGCLADIAPNPHRADGHGAAEGNDWKVSSGEGLREKEERIRDDHKNRYHRFREYCGAFSGCGGEL